MKNQPKDFWLGLIRALASEKKKKKRKKKLFYIFRHCFIYFINLFYNSSHILVFIFTYNLIK